LESTRCEVRECSARRDANGEPRRTEGCGIVGIVGASGNVALPLYYALYALQHRGQEAAGIAVSSGAPESEISDLTGCEKAIQLFKGMGLVNEVFSPDALEALEGTAGIGHVQYSTGSATTVENAEPLVVNYRKGDIAIALNGSLVNAGELRQALEREGRIFHADTHTEVIAQLLAKELLRHPPIEALKEVTKCLIGSYSLVILLDNAVLAVRDPLGIKPLCIGTLTAGESGACSGYLIASESPAIDTLGGKPIRDVNPGEVLLLQPPVNAPARSAGPPRAITLESHQLYRSMQSAHCVFEYVYFARPDSIIDGRLVYDIRMKIGTRLAEEHGVDADIVSPVPDSGITFAIGYAKRAGIDYKEGLIKNRYVGRTFIMPGQTSRDLAVRLKLNVVRTNVAGKRVVLVDDSIVRGTTSRRIVEHLKQQGAKEVHLRIGSQPIIAPCYLGIDTPKREDLLAWNRDLDEIAAFLNADSVRYISREGLIKAVGIEEQNLCLGCLTGRYPVEIPGEICIARQLRLSQFQR
jgi:amidophosphoribosyltransferase